MAQPPSSSPRRRNDESELWFSMPSSARHEHEPVRVQEQTAYHATSNRQNVQRPATPECFPPIPSISTTTMAVVNKPLPPSPEAEKRKRKPMSLRSLVRRRPSDQHNPSHLKPEPHHHQRSTSANGNLSPEPYQYYHHQSSRSMPTSPLEYSQASYQASILERSHSAAANFSDSTPYQAYQMQQQESPHRSVSVNTFFDPQAPRTRRTFPETPTPSSAAPYNSISERQRPHTWLSPTETEAFGDAAEFHLFVEATSGLPDGIPDFSGLSPSSPQVQGSLFARSRQNDRIPLPFQNPPTVTRSQSHQVRGWQGMGYDYPSAPSRTVDQPLVSSSALPPIDPHQRSQLSPNLNAINLELERLGLSDEGEPEDELPDYAQSQAEMSAKRRKEATDRARELEARWNNSRGGRGR
jgi:hypothetical protein